MTHTQSFPRAGRISLRLLPGAAGALLLLLPLALPLWLRARRDPIVRVPCDGGQGRSFERLRFASECDPRGPAPRWLDIRKFLALVHIARGEMRWIGPRPLAGDEQPPAALRDARQSAQAGWLCLWSLRVRTLIDYGNEWDADAEYLRRRHWRYDLGLLLRHALVSALTCTRAGQAARERVRIVDVELDNLSMDKAVGRIHALLDAAGPPAQVCFVNPACVNIAARRRDYRAVLRHARLVLPDGIGLKIAGDLLSTPLRQNVNGTDLFPRLCAELAGTGHGIYLLGGRPGVAAQAARQACERHPQLHIAGHHHGYFDLDDAREVARVLQAMRASGASLLLVAMGVPQQDLFIARHLRATGASVAMGVGGLFDFASGRMPRAPQWLRELGGEWVYRLMREPARMWRRYLIGNFTFLSRVLGQRLGHERAVCRVVWKAAEAETPAASHGQRRCVLFATAAADPLFPVAEGLPAALLPAGSCSALELALQELAGAGCRHVDLVASDMPESIRARVGDGTRWGLNLRIHLASSGSHPYGILQRLAADWPGHEQVVLGHAEVVPRGPLLEGLYEAPQTLCLSGVEADGRWSGWASLPAAELAAGHADCDRSQLFRRLAERLPRSEAREGELACLDSMEAWLRTRERQLEAVEQGELPPLSKPYPWGACGAGSRLANGAAILGPVLIGERCVIAADAVIGPNVVLGDGVVIGPGTRVRDATVLPGVYVAGGLDLAEAVVGQGGLYSWRWRARLALAADDGIIAPVRKPAPRHGLAGASSLPARALAATLAAPLLAAAAGYAWFGRRMPVASLWLRRPVVGGRDPRTGQWLACRVREPRAAGRAWWIATLGLLGCALDVAGGQRRWIGPRPRTEQELSMLPRDWQVLLGARLPGVWHAPGFHDAMAALHDDGGQTAAMSGETIAAADVCALVSEGGLSVWRVMRQRWRLMRT